MVNVEPAHRKARRREETQSRSAPGRLHSTRRRADETPRGSDRERMKTGHTEKPFWEAGYFNWMEKFDNL